MVRFLVKKGDENQFLYEAPIDTPMNIIYEEITIIYNGRLKVNKLCYEVEALSQHGPSLPPEMQGLVPGQAEELKLVDEWAGRCEASGGWSESPDPLGRRNGRQPSEAMRTVLARAVEEAKSALAKAQVDASLPLTLGSVREALHQLRGACLVVFPMGLPPHDPANISISECEDLASMEVDLAVMLDPGKSVIWFCGRQLPREGKLSAALGTANDKTRATVKLTGPGQGPPAREPALDEKERLALLAHYHRKQQELEVGVPSICQI